MRCARAYRRRWETSHLVQYVSILILRFLYYLGWLSLGCMGIKGGNIECMWCLSVNIESSYDISDSWTHVSRLNPLPTNIPTNICILSIHLHNLMNVLSNLPDTSHHISLKSQVLRTEEVVQRWLVHLLKNINEPLSSGVRTQLGYGMYNQGDIYNRGYEEGAVCCVWIYCICLFCLSICLSVYVHVICLCSCTNAPIYSLTQGGNETGSSAEGSSWNAGNN